MTAKQIRALIIAGVVAFLGIITTCSSMDIVKQRERGIRYHLGQVKGEVIQPGVVWHAPFVDSIHTYTIVPQEYEVEFKVGTADCAVTKDLQDLGMRVNVKYVFAEDRIKEIALRYGDSAITAAMRTKIQSSAKATAAKYTIYEAVEKQTDISKEIGELVMREMTQYPIEITTVDVVNLNWSDEFDRQIKETANRTQQVKIATQEAEIAAAQAQKRVKEAEANKQAAELDAQAMQAKAQGEAAAKRIRADADAYEAQKIAQNQQAYQKQWDYEIEMKKAEKWDGHYVPSYIPLTAAGGIVNLPSNVNAGR